MRLFPRLAVALLIASAAISAACTGNDPVIGAEDGDGGNAPAPPGDRDGAPTNSDASASELDAAAPSCYRAPFTHFEAKPELSQGDDISITFSPDERTVYLGSSKLDGGAKEIFSATRVPEGGFPGLT